MPERQEHTPVPVMITERDLHLRQATRLAEMAHCFKAGYAGELELHARRFARGSGPSGVRLRPLSMLRRELALAPLNVTIIALVAYLSFRLILHCYFRALR